MRMTVLALSLALAAAPLSAAELETVPVTEGVWALVGPMAQRSPENLANNATFGVIETETGVVLVDPGGSRRGAAAIDAAIDTLTDKPVTLVIDTGGQDHRWLGNGYWAAQGAEIVASEAAVADQRARASRQLSLLRALLGPALEGTEPRHAGTTFEDRLVREAGGVRLEIVHAGPAHTPGDSYVWLPGRDVMFTGDIVFVDRLLGVLPVSSSRGWIAAFDAMAAHEPTHVVPGHGHPTGLATARAHTRDYLAHLRAEIGAHLGAGGDMLGASGVDQSPFAHLLQFEALAGRNAEAVFAEMEWE